MTCISCCIFESSTETCQFADGAGAGDGTRTGIKSSPNFPHGVMRARLSSVVMIHLDLKAHVKGSGVSNSEVSLFKAKHVSNKATATVIVERKGEFWRT